MKPVLSMTKIRGDEIDDGIPDPQQRHSQVNVGSGEGFRLLGDGHHPPDGYYWLMNSKTFWVQQVPSEYTSELQVALHESSPLYDVFNERGHCVFKAVNQESIRGRTESPFSSFKFDVVDSAGIPFLDVRKHRHRFWNLLSTWCPCWCFGPVKNEATIMCADGNAEWLLQQQFRLGHCRKTSFRAIAEGSSLCDVWIEGPGDICALGYPHTFADPGESNRFIFRDPAQSHELAIVRKIYPLSLWSGPQSTCPLAIIFNDRAELKHRIIALGCAFLFDFMFFQKERA